MFKGYPVIQGRIVKDEHHEIKGHPVGNRRTRYNYVTGGHSVKFFFPESLHQD